MVYYPDDLECKTADCQKRKLDRVVEVMLAGDDPDNFPYILSTINRHLYQFKLQKMKTAVEVFNETYLRAVRRIEAGEMIANIPAWFRRTALNVVREWSRTEIRQGELVQTQAAETCSLQSRLEVMAMFERFVELKPIERKLLQLRAMGLTWEEVAQRLIEDGEATANPQLPRKLAQQASRIRAKIRQEPGALN
jgi:DNA-directed RNA polymerase specialized sigma24 family protein